MLTVMRLSAKTGYLADVIKEAELTPASYFLTTSDREAATAVITTTTARVMIVYHNIEFKFNINFNHDYFLVMQTNDATCLKKTQNFIPRIARNLQRLEYF